MTTKPTTTQEDEHQNKQGTQYTSNKQKITKNNQEPIVSEILRIGPLKSLQKYIRIRPNDSKNHKNREDDQNEEKSNTNYKNQQKNKQSKQQKVESSPTRTNIKTMMNWNQKGREVFPKNRKDNTQKIYATNLVTKAKNQKETTTMNEKNANQISQTQNTEVLDMEIQNQALNMISNDYINNNESWKNLEEVEKRLIVLHESLQKCNEDEEKKKQIECIIKTYTIRKEELEIEEGKKNTLKKRSENMIDMTVDDDNTIMSGFTETSLDQNVDNNNKYKGKSNMIQNPYSPSRKRNILTKNQLDLNSNEKKKKVTNNTTISNDQQMTTYSQATRLNHQKTKDLQIKEDKNGEKNKTNNQIRIRMQFRAKNYGDVTYGTKIKNVLYEIMQCAKIIDPQAALMPWKQKSTTRNLNGNEIKLQSDEDIIKYINIPENPDNIIPGKTYFHNGVRIKTNETVYNFVEIWNNMKYNREPNSPFNEWKPIKQSEMQMSDTAYPIGYFAGTTERGDYETIARTISNHTKTPAELSFQYVNQQGISNKIWEHATKMASKDFPNQASSQHKRVKFKYAPSALVVYVPSMEHIHTAKQNLLTEYGKPIGKNKLWPMLDDGSRSRFIPIIKGYIKKKRIFKFLEDNLWKQAVGKAGEATFSLEMNDLKSKKDYLGNQTMEYILHNAAGDDQKPMIKHISRKWSKNPKDNILEITVSMCMIEKAAELMKSLKTILSANFTNKALDHFNDRKKYKEEHDYPTKPNFEEELERFLFTEDDEDNYSNVLIEGMESILAMKDIKYNKSNGKITNKKQEDENDKEESEKTDEEMSELETKVGIQMKKKKVNKDKNDEEMSDIDSKVYPELDRKWREISIATEVHNMAKATTRERDKIKRTMQKRGLTIQDIIDWKVSVNYNYNEILTNCENNEYEAYKRIISEIIRNKKREKDDEMIQQELEAIAEEIDEDKNKKQKSKNISNGNFSTPESSEEEDYYA